MFSGFARLSSSINRRLFCGFDAFEIFECDVRFTIEWELLHGNMELPDVIVYRPACYLEFLPDMFQADIVVLLRFVQMTASFINNSAEISTLMNKCQ